MGCPEYIYKVLPNLKWIYSYTHCWIQRPLLDNTFRQSTQVESCHTEPANQFLPPHIEVRLYWLRFKWNATKEKHSCSLWSDLSWNMKHRAVILEKQHFVIHLTLLFNGFDDNLTITATLLITLQLGVVVAMAKASSLVKWTKNIKSTDHMSNIS